MGLGVGVGGWTEPQSCGWVGGGRRVGERGGYRSDSGRGGGEGSGGGEASAIYQKYSQMSIASVCLSRIHLPPSLSLFLYNNGFEQVFLFDYGNVNTFYPGVGKKTA